jgi:hypothetical protein
MSGFGQRKLDIDRGTSVDRRTPTAGMIRSSTIDRTAVVNAAPTVNPIARSTMLPRRTNF